jgi:hypothetical protein
MSMGKTDNNRTTYHAFCPSPTPTLQSFAQHSEKANINFSSQTMGRDGQRGTVINNKKAFLMTVPSLFEPKRG